MKRRSLILAAGALVPAVGRGAIPCPPPQVSVSGGGTATTNCQFTSGNSYSTNFGATENPISEGGRWVNGRAVGLAWNNVQTTPGKAFAASFVGSPSRYNDPIAHLNTSFTPNQFAQGTVFRVPGYFPPDGHEIELLVRFQITANSARGYEVLWNHSGIVAIVRWNGPLGNYTELASGNIGPAVDGDVLRLEIVGSLISVRRNGALVMTASNTTWSDGQPGIGFWPLPGAILANYGWRSFQAGSL